ncbi:hypothetical protein D3C86_1445520 [compost metagenome]
MGGCEPSLPVSENVIGLSGLCRFEELGSAEQRLEVRLRDDTLASVVLVRFDVRLGRSEVRIGS